MKTPIHASKRTSGVVIRATPSQRLKPFKVPLSKATRSDEGVTSQGTTPAPKIRDSQTQFMTEYTQPQKNGFCLSRLTRSNQQQQRQKMPSLSASRRGVTRPSGARGSTHTTSTCLSGSRECTKIHSVDRHCICYTEQCSAPRIFFNAGRLIT
jgi:hypothetical protein